MLHERQKHNNVCSFYLVYVSPFVLIIFINKGVAQ
jgi:hypothetical protein